MEISKPAKKVVVTFNRDDYTWPVVFKTPSHPQLGFVYVRDVDKNGHVIISPPPACNPDVFFEFVADCFEPKSNFFSKVEEVFEPSKKPFNIRIFYDSKTIDDFEGLYKKMKKERKERKCEIEKLIQIVTTEKFLFSSESAKQKWEKVKNDDITSFVIPPQVFRYASCWAKLMQYEIQRGKKLGDIAEKTSAEAGKLVKGPGGQCYGAAVLLFDTWKYSEDLKEWYYEVATLS